VSSGNTVPPNTCCWDTFRRPCDYILNSNNINIAIGNRLIGGYIEHVSDHLPCKITLRIDPLPRQAAVAGPARAQTSLQAIGALGNRPPLITTNFCIYRNYLVNNKGNFNRTNIVFPIGGIQDMFNRQNGLNDAGRQPSLFDLAEMRNTTNNTIICFHGTSSNFIAGLGNQGERISTQYGNGRLGEGFYITFNPNEALSYACFAAANQPPGAIPVIYEIHINNANRFLRGGGNPVHTQPGHVPPAPLGTAPRANAFVASPRLPGPTLVDIRRTSDTRVTHFEQNSSDMGKEQLAIYFQHNDLLRQNIDITMTRIHRWNNTQIFDVNYQNIRNFTSYERQYNFGQQPCI